MYTPQKGISQKGFTLVELVVVILILGILAATALPRFMNVSNEAHTAAVSGAGGGFGAGVALVHAQWIANRSTAAVAAVPNFGASNVGVNASGWPVGTGVTTIGGAGDCVNIWDNIMQNPPSVATGTGEDYQAANTGQSCTYTYQAVPTKAIIYDATNGAVNISQ